MSYYRPLKEIRGIQLPNNICSFEFSWNQTEHDSRAHFLWVYKERESKPQMRKYAQCINNSIQVDFQYNTVPMQEVRKVKFLIFLSEEQKAPSPQEIRQMSQNPQFICEVCCGTGELSWKWVKDKSGIRQNLLINSNKKIPEGILYYDYFYKNKIFSFNVPGDINIGENIYPPICVPDVSILPQLKSKETNLTLSDATEGGGVFKKLKGIFGARR